MSAPTLELAIADANGFLQDASAYLRVDQGLEITCGRLDQSAEVEPGTFTFTLDNTDGTWASGVTDALVRLREPDDGTSNYVWAEDASFEDGTEGSWVAVSEHRKADGTPALSLTSEATYAQVGSRSLYVLINQDSSFPQTVELVCGVPGLVKGQQYTASIYVRVAAGQGAVTFEAQDDTGTSTDTSSTTGAFERLVVTFTVPADYTPSPTYAPLIERGEFPFTVSWLNNTSATEEIYLDGFMVNEGASAATFTTTQPTDKFTGYVQRWPVGWPGGTGTTSLVTIVATDILGRYARTPLRSAVYEELLQPIPTTIESLDSFTYGAMVYYPLDEPAGSTQASDRSGTADLQHPQYFTAADDRLVHPPLIKRASGGGGGDSLAFGAPGSPLEGGTAVSFTPPGTGSNYRYLHASWDHSFGIDQRNTDRTYVLCFQVGTAQTDALLFRWADQNMSYGYGSWHELTLTSTGTLFFKNYRLDTLAEGEETLTTVDDGEWHIVHLVHRYANDASNPCLELYLDGVLDNSFAYGTSSTVPHANYGDLYIGGGPGAVPFNGSIAHFAAYDTVLGTNAIARHANALVNQLTENTATRLDRYLDYAGHSPKRRRLSTGLTTAVGPNPTVGRSVTEALLSIATTEGGLVYADRSGDIVLRARDELWNGTAALSLTGDELAPDTVFMLDNQTLVNRVTAYSTTGGQAVVEDADSIAAHGVYAATIDVATEDAEALRAAAEWMVANRKEPAYRLDSVTVDLLPLTAVKATTATTLELGDVISVSSLPASAPYSSVSLLVDGYREYLSAHEWSITYTTSSRPTAFVLDTDEIDTSTTPPLGY